MLKICCPGYSKTKYLGIMVYCGKDLYIFINNLPNICIRQTLVVYVQLND